MMDKYTPGPWTSLGNQVRAGRFNVVPSVTAGGMGAQPREKHGYACANARLIAAAPELLEALEAAMKFIGSHVADPDITDEMARNYAALLAANPNAAIAKATGATA